MLRSRMRATGARVRAASRSNRSGPGIVRHRVVIRLVGRSDSLRKTNAGLNFDRARVGGICIPPRSLCVRFSETRPVPVIRSSIVQYTVVPSREPRPQWERHHVGCHTVWVSKCTFKAHAFERMALTFERRARTFETRRDSAHI